MKRGAYGKVDWTRTPWYAPRKLRRIKAVPMPGTYETRKLRRIPTW
jgi:hypothetical protein